MPGAFVLGDSTLGGDDVLGDASDFIAEVINITDIGPEPIRFPAAIISSLGIAISPSSGQRQAISGIAFCNATNARAVFHLETGGGTEILLTAAYNGRTIVNVQYGTA